MRDSDNQIGQAIRNLRIAHGQTQRELGDAIGVEKTTISEYERGKNHPNIEILMSIANHYGVPLERLVSEDFDGLKMDTAELTWTKLSSVIKTTFPLVKSESAMKNPHFANGYRHCSMLMDEIIKSPLLVMADHAEIAFDEFLVASDDKDCSEAYINTVWLMMLICIAQPDTHAIKLGEAILNGKGKKSDFVKKYMLPNVNPTTREEIENKRTVAIESRKIIIELLGQAKAEPRTSRLADYYLALTYYFNITNNRHSPSLNVTIGEEMMNCFAALGNPYALAFLTSSRKLL